MNEIEQQKDYLDFVREAQSLEEVKQLYTHFQIKKREMNWVDGDTVVIALEKFGDTKETYGQLAQIGMGTVKHLEQIARISRAFPDKEERDTSYPWSMYRAAFQAASRTGEDPFEVFCYGVSQNWHTRDFRKYGRPEEVAFVLKCTCPMCGFKFAIEGDKFITATLECPICKTEGELTLLPGEFQRKDS